MAGITQREVSKILVKADSFSRIYEFETIANRLKGKMYWKNLRYAYQCSDDLFNCKDLVYSLFTWSEPGCEYLMNKKERSFLNDLPETFTIYRGMTVQEYESLEFGVSWTLKKEVAEFFAYDYVRNYSTAHQTKMILEMVVNKRDVLAYFHGKEFEIIYINY